MSKKRKRATGKKGQRRQGASPLQVAMEVRLAEVINEKKKRLSNGIEITPEVLAQWLINHSAYNGMKQEDVGALLKAAVWKQDLKPTSVVITGNGKIKAQSETNDPDESGISTATSTTPELSQQSPPATPPQSGERVLLLLLTKEERVNIPGDLAEEFAEIAAKHGARYAKLWYYKQVAASTWPMMRKAIRWGILTWVVEWVRRRV